MHQSLGGSVSRAASLAVLVLAAGCKITPESDVRRPVLPDRGTHVVTGVWNGFAFTADGAEVIYNAGGPLRAVDANYRDREVDPEAHAGDELLVARDGSAVYCVSQATAAPPTFALREVLAGVDVATIPNPAPGALALSPSGEDAFVAGSAGQDAQVIHLADGTRTPVACAADGVPVRFSPAGDELVCRHAGVEGEPLVRLRIADGSTVPLSQPLRFTFSAARWGDDGIQLAGFWGDELAVFEPETGDTAMVYTLPGNDPGVSDQAPKFYAAGLRMEFTKDGRGLAFTEIECLLNGGRLGACAPYEEGRIVVVDLRTASGRTVASGPWSGVIDGVAFSPDGRTLAYQFDDSLYVRPTGL